MLLEAKMNDIDISIIFPDSDLAIVLLSSYVSVFYAYLFLSMRK